MADLSAAAHLKIEYLSAGGNRHPSAADWDVSGVFAYGAGTNIALASGPKRVSSILTGHTDVVNAVKFIPGSSGFLLSGSVDKTIKVWKRDLTSEDFRCVQTISDHGASINCFGAFNGSNMFVSGSADAVVKIWSLDNENLAKMRQTIELTPHFFPLAIALSPLAGAPQSYVLAVAGTRDIILLFILNQSQSPDFKLQAILSGHEGWIRSLEFTRETPNSSSDLLLASSSQDKYIRLWRIHQGKDLPAAAASGDPSLGAFMPRKALGNKAHRFKADDIDFSATFEALLLGHDDWIYSAKWKFKDTKLQLLSASADNSLAIWEADAATGVWVTIARLGEISAEKGSTTATGSTGGFWTGHWSPLGETVICLSKTGGWRLWNRDANQDRWVPDVTVTGHTQSITGIAWSKYGDYLLSTSSDQTTRLHARWRAEASAWHEMARPQIHGYDLNCVDALGTTQFVSGADEKLLRVFNEPQAVARLLHNLSGVHQSHIEEMPDAANMPVLGLSNKAIEAEELDRGIADDGENSQHALDAGPIVHKSTLDLDHPPLEEHLSRHTLWPETEKLYGHGYEISCLAASHDGTLIATACKASSIDHAVIRLFETKTWHEIKPPLTAHSLTATRLRFSHDDQFLLSVGRDRQWAVFERDAQEKYVYKLAEGNPKGHSRMILDATWAPTERRVFATAGRDKQVKIWARDTENPKNFAVKATIPQEHPATAVDFMSTVFQDGSTYLAIGTELGSFAIYSLLAQDSFSLKLVELLYQGAHILPSKSITQLAWKPFNEAEDGKFEMKLAIASEDSSLRVYSINPIFSNP